MLHTSNDFNSGNRRIVRNTIFLYIRMIIVLLISLYTSRAILSLLGVEDFGLYNVIAGFVSIFGFFNASLTASIQRFYNFEYGKEYEHGMQKVYKASVYIEILLALVVFFLLEIVGAWYINNKLVVPEGRLLAANILFQLSLFQLIMVMLQAPYASAIMARERMDYYSLVGIIDVVLKLFIVLLLSRINYDHLISYAIAYSFISVIDFFLYFFYAKYHFKELSLSGINIDKKIFKQMISFSGWNILGAIAMMARTQGLNLILNAFFGTVVNAARGIAVQVQGALMGFVGNISNAARPQLVEAYAKEDYDRSFVIMQSISKVSFVFLFAMVLPIAINIDFILHLWLGNAVPKYTNVFTILILLSALVDILNTPVTMLVMATGKISKYCFWTSIVGILVLPFSYILLKEGFEPSSVFVVGVICSVVVQIVSLTILYLITRFNIRSYLVRVVLPLLGLLILIPPPLYYFRYLIGENWKSFVLTVFLGLILIITYSYLIVLNQKEKELLNGLIVKFLRKTK